MFGKNEVQRVYLTRVQGATHANKSHPKNYSLVGGTFIHLVSFYCTHKMSNKPTNDTDSDVSELDPKELSNALNYDKYACQLGYAEDPETPLTAETFPSKSGGKPVSFHCSVTTISLFDFSIFIGLVEP
jgi:hypothetical protein